jgi:hypothetical protein
MEQIQLLPMGRPTESHSGNIEQVSNKIFVIKMETEC